MGATPAGLFFYGVSCHNRATAAGQQRIERVGDHAIALRGGVQVDLRRPRRGVPHAGHEVGHCCAQLGAIQAGGAFHLLAGDRPDTPTLTAVRRFTEPWEADASLHLRDGDPDAIDTYLDHDRVVSGDRAAMLHAVFDAWAADTDAGLSSAMIAGDEATVAELNALAQAHHRDNHSPAHTGSHAHSVPLAVGHTAGIGDRIRTRRNDRRLPTGQHNWVKNGDTWTVTQIHPDGSLTARSVSETSSVRLPAGYVAEHVELGYATTIHRAQGATLDTAHALLDEQTTREALYVAATRGRHSNRFYLDTSTRDRGHDVDVLDRDANRSSDPHAALAAALGRSAATASAHAALADAENRVNIPSPYRRPCNGRAA